jgi:hypothetical protein
MIEDRRLCLSARRAGDPLLIGNTRHCIEYFLTAIVSVTEVTDWRSSTAAHEPASKYKAGLPIT